MIAYAAEVIPVVVATDWPAIIVALATFVTALTAAVVSIIAAYRAGRAEKQSQETQKTVDGSLVTMLELIKKGAAAEAILENDKLQAVLQAAVDKAVSAEREKGRELARAVAAPAPAEVPQDVRIVKQEEPVPVILQEKPK